MSEEIKETLDDIKRHLDYVEATKQSSIRDNEMKTMYEYITSLQQRVEQLEKENKELRDENKRIFQNVNDDELLISNAMNYAELKKAEKRVEQLEKENIKQKEIIENLTTMTVYGDKKQIKNTAQYKLEQLEKENEQLRTQVNAYENPDDLTLFYMWLDEKAKDKIKQLENIRKEAINNILKDISMIKTIHAMTTGEIIVRLEETINILNKGDNNGK